MPPGTTMTLADDIQRAISDDDLASALSMVFSRESLLDQSNRWHSLNLLRFISSKSAFPQIEDKLGVFIDAYHDFLPGLSEIMQASAREETILKSAGCLRLLLQQQAEKYASGAPLWVINAFVEALLLVGSTVDLEDQNICAILESRAAGFLESFSSLLDFVCQNEVAFLSIREAQETGNKVYWCVGYDVHGSLASFDLPYPVHFVDFLDLVSLNDFSRDGFLQRALFRSFVTRFGEESEFVVDRALATLAGRRQIPDDGVLSLLNFFYQSFARLLRGKATPGVRTQRPRNDFPERQLKRSAKNGFIRAGNVDLALLECFKSQPRETLLAAEQVVCDLWDARETSIELIPKTPVRIHGNEPRDSVLRMSLQTGWYSTPRNARHDLVAWIDAYTSAFSTCSVIEGHNEMFLPIMGTDLCPETGEFLRFSEEEFFRLLDGRRVAFVTAYADDLQGYYDAGHLSTLWGAIGVKSQIQSLKTLRAPFSIWPYYPGDSWLSTFESVAAEAQRTILENDCDVFLASAGCYGVPLAACIAEKFPHILALNYGHHVNTCFGVKSNKTSILDARGIRNSDIPLVESAFGSSYPDLPARADLIRYA
jgi:hypothetical protein